MNRFLCLAVLCVAATSAGQVSAADWCKFKAERSATTELAGAKRIVIAAGAGDLKIAGASGQAGVRASGRACASSEELLKEIQLESRREGDTLYLKTLLPDVDGGNIFFFNRYATLDLTVSLPETVAIEVEDSSGDTQIKHVQSANVADGSGDLEIADVAADLEVSDSSGDLDIRKVGGNLSVKDSSGDIEIADVQGNVFIPVDSSGDIRIANISGGVHIVSDSSGGIVIEHVKQSVAIDSDSSGDIRVDDIGGNFTVGNDGSGGISHARVVGQVQLPPGK